VTTVVALLRAVNVGGTKPVPMTALCRMLTDAGFTGVRSILHSGNVVFNGPQRAGAALEKLLEETAARRLGVQTDFFVRSAREWDAVVASNPFPDEARDDPGHLIVMALKAAPAQGDVAALQAGIVGREVVHAVGKHAYIHFPDGMGRSKLTNAVLERALHARSTARNWNTVLKLAAAAAECGRLRSDG
jgi:uncharacterized protein (DUF1697 family)